MSGNPDVLVLLLDAGCPLDTPDIHGAFPLHYTAQEAKEPPQDGNIAQTIEYSTSHHKDVCVSIVFYSGCGV